jgi:hypothetical protein
MAKQATFWTRETLVAAYALRQMGPSLEAKYRFAAKLVDGYLANEVWARNPAKLARHLLGTITERAIRTSRQVRR